jgi:hypothetical protein
MNSELKPGRPSHPRTNLKVGVKIYDNGWFLRHHMRPEALADLLVKMGVTWVIAQSRFLPMADSAVESAVSAQEAARYADLDDVAFRHSLQERGIAYFAALNICFDPAYAATYPERLPIDQFGRRETKQDWYVGLAPVLADNLSRKQALLEAAAAALQPDGVHLGFIRWPGFWETWLPDIQRSEMPDTCYSRLTLSQFCAAKAVDLPIDDPVGAAQVIAHKYKAEWRDWKCDATVAAIAQLRRAIHSIQPTAEISINTLPFFRQDFDDAVEEVFGQDVSKLREVVDVFEVMAYHQILCKPAIWPAAVASDIKLRSGQRTVCTLQTRPLYLDGMHAGRGRSLTLGPEEFAQAVDSLETSAVDGLCLFTLTDLLGMQSTTAGQAMIGRIREFRR